MNNSTFRTLLPEKCLRFVNVPAALAFLCAMLGQQMVLKAQGPGQTTSPSPAAASTPAAVSPSQLPLTESYVVAADDQLDVYIFGVPELSRTYVVSPVGTLAIPLLPTPLQAAGLTPDQLARAIEEAFRQSGRLKRPEVEVSVRQPASGPVTVDGGVRNPQVLPIFLGTKLVDVLAHCGGLADTAGTEITISRGPLALRTLAAEGEVASPILALDVKKVMDGNDPASMTMVWPGDRVSVSLATAGFFYVLGEVRSPGGYALRGGENDFTALRALAMAGDVNWTAKKAKAFLIRQDSKAPGGRTEIPLNLPNILKGRSQDPKLVANDILYVPGSGGRKALHSLGTVPGMVTSNAGSAVILAK